MTECSGSDLLRLTCLDVRVDVRSDVRSDVDVRSLAPWLERDWAFCLSPEPAAPATAEVRLRLDPSLSRDRQRADLVEEITLAAINAAYGRLLMFHAGAVADPETGRAMAFVAASGTGKSTLAKALGGRFAYVTDEMVGIRADGTVAPFAKPLMIHLRPEDDYKAPLAPEVAGLVAVPAGLVLTLARLTVLHRDPQHRGSPVVERLAPLDVLFELVTQMCHLRAFSHPLHRVMGLVESLGGVDRVTYAEAADLAPLVEATLAESS